MPTYTYQCQHCGTGHEAIQSISSYCVAPVVPQCCAQPAQRVFLPTGANIGDLVMASDAHYANCRSTDGTDLSTRAKHRQYMLERGLTTSDDYKETWSNNLKTRLSRRRAEQKDKNLRHIIAREVYRRIA